MSYRARVRNRRGAIRRRRAVRLGVVLLVACGLVTSEVAILTRLWAGPDAAQAQGIERPGEPELVEPDALIPVPKIVQAEQIDSPCAEEDAGAALQAVDPAAILESFGGAGAMREAIAAGAADCVALDDPRLPWVVVNKLRPLDPIDYAPAQLETPRPNLGGYTLRADAAAAYERLAEAIETEGPGAIALNSGYRSYRTQVTTYESQQRSLGTEQADALSAHPGHSEHQTGLAADVVACGAGCGTIYEMGATDQGRWLAENAWRFGWIVRYEAEQTHITGYDPEPWHLRFIGVELAEQYHAGGFHTLEEFFGLPAAPAYE